ncbi:MAG: hypothetical protein OES46_12580 [Gammaproteobacteria bacterium]|nr:hypothetical protein [Gammaproteobacteria bacterium]
MRGQIDTLENLDPLFLRKPQAIDQSLGSLNTGPNTSRAVICFSGSHRPLVLAALIWINEVTSRGVLM